MSLCVCVCCGLMIREPHPTASLGRHVRTRWKKTVAWGGMRAPQSTSKGRGSGGRGLGSAMFCHDRSRSACTGLRPVLGSARWSPRSRVAGVCEDVRKIIPPQVRVEGSVWCPRAPAFGRACRIMLLFPMYGASSCKDGKTGHVTARCSCAGG